MIIKKRRIVEYRLSSGRRPYAEWLEGLAPSAQGRIEGRVFRAGEGYFGDTRNVGFGVNELRFHFGPGYRVYFAIDGAGPLVLLSGGDKSTQRHDIKVARSMWIDYQRRGYGKKST